MHKESLLLGNGSTQIVQKIAIIIQKAHFLPFKNSYPNLHRRQSFLSQYSFCNWSNACESAAVHTGSPAPSHRRVT